MCTYACRLHGWASLPHLTDWTFNAQCIGNTGRHVGDGLVEMSSVHADTNTICARTYQSTARWVGDVWAMAHHHLPPPWQQRSLGRRGGGGPRVYHPLPPGQPALALQVGGGEGVAPCALCLCTAVSLLLARDGQKGSTN